MAQRPKHPEPVPSATQLMALPFVGAVAGFLEARRPAKLRVTLHRTMDRDGEQYLQQVCSYMPTEGETWPVNIVGRILDVTSGIIGEAYRTGRIYRTKHYDTNEALMADLAADMKDVGDSRSPDDVAKSYLAVPFVDSKNEAVLVLYADCKSRNFFANDHLVQDVRDMCASFGILLDKLQSDPLPLIRNYPVSKGQPSRGAETVYPRLQEAAAPSSPRLEKMRTFNYESAAG